MGMPWYLYNHDYITHHITMQIKYGLFIDSVIGYYGA